MLPDLDGFMCNCFEDQLNIIPNGHETYQFMFLYAWYISVSHFLFLCMYDIKNVLS